MSDSTQELKLETKWQQRYVLLRFLISVIFLLTASFLVYKILFPSTFFSFSFGKPISSKNLNINARIPGEGPYENGNVAAGEKLVFDTSLVGDYSIATVDFNLEENSPNGLTGKINIRKSYQAFFYPTGAPLGFRDGSLLKNNTDYFIVSNGKMRKFSSPEVLSKFAFDKEAFLEVSAAELALHSNESELTVSSSYPSDSLFHIQDEYYQLKENTLLRFVSERAYLSQYAPNQAIEKDPSFLNNYKLSEEYIGFADGTLLAADISVYIASGKQTHPVNNPVTFEAMGYQWSDIINANSEEIGMYEKQKLFTIKSPHPDGTIFHTKDSNKYFYIQNGIKREITSKAILSTYAKANYIAINENDSNIDVACDIKKSRFDIFGLGFHTCETKINSLKNFIGNSYQFRVTANKPVTINSLNITFSEIVNWDNTKKSLALLKNRAMNNYISK